ncbi:S41 family peptidase [Pseudomonas rubra]|uniref:S41 family peptidase n=1 Tax=Pseudomonas rubra TaxID=2942627 RepID=A0ABT5PGK7_9PSED|nr:S41 family peptidase [Pseudomonas rubra]MDD1017331.1 S41 family peptidase [Pseudomonas rubra]MDD1039123.1 S41 family peptidase [Pseudomonas rubra]MDD1156940.1 S41 family peptidase [Pseudomonas rubra]
MAKAKVAGNSKNSKIGSEHRKSSAYLKRMSVSVRDLFAGAVDLTTFLGAAGNLSLDERKLLVRQALILIEQNYVHLPLKRAMHAVEPVQRLKLLLQELEITPPLSLPPETLFHRELTEIFTLTRDLHTNYLLPAPFNKMTAFLPFLVEDYFQNGRRRYLVSHVAQGFSHPTFVSGVELVSWNGIPIERAVLNNAQRYAGSNREAQHSRGVSTLTTRVLKMTLPPDEGWVIVGYQTVTGKFAEVRIDWMVNPTLPSGEGRTGDVADDPKFAHSIGLDLEQHLIQRMRKALFSPKVVAAEKKASEKVRRGGNFKALESTMPGVFEARSVTTLNGTFGYLRIRTFAAPVTAFVEEFIRLVTALPQNGLIIDVRGNGGGTIMNGELILQVLTPRRIEPEPVQFINTPLNLQICLQNRANSPVVDLSAWVESMQQALQTGAIFSAAFPISDPEECNLIGQKYFGPAVLVTDALCYSTTDFFAAGFQDHEIGPVLGADGNTGAGGANVWTHDLLRELLPGAGSVYQPLPAGAGMRVSMRRGLRVGRRAGLPVEDLGILPDERHFMTKNDLLSDNVDLINKAGSLLAARQPAKAFTISVSSISPAQWSAIVTTQEVTRLDVYLDGRPIQSVDVQNGQASLTVTKLSPVTNTLEVQGFDEAKLVVRYRTNI